MIGYGAWAEGVHERRRCKELHATDIQIQVCSLDLGMKCAAMRGCYLKQPDHRLMAEVEPTMPKFNLASFPGGARVCQWMASAGREARG